GLDQPAHLPEGDGPAIVTAVFPGVETGHAEQRIVPKSALLPAPSDETAHGATVVIARLQGTAGVAEPRQRGLNLGGRQVGEPGWRNPLGDSPPGRLALAASHSPPIHLLRTCPGPPGHH